MFCSSCGTQIPTGAAFCPACRTAIPSNNLTTATSPYVAPLQASAPSPLYEVSQQNAYQPLNPYATPPPPPPPRRKAKIGLIIGTAALVLILASAAVFALFRPPAKDNLPGKATTSPTTTARTNPTTTATPLPITATTTGNLETIPYAPNHGMQALNDPLRDNSHFNFGEANSNGVVCQFTKGSYHVETTGQSTAICVAPATDFSNLVYEVQMTIIKGDGGGIFFRSDFNSTKLYHFFVGVNGIYSLILYTDSSHSKILRNSSLSAAINQGLNQTNLIAVGANGNTITLYVNHQQLVSVNDTTYSHGQIGLVAESYVGSVNPTDVAFNNAKVWTLP